MKKLTFIFAMVLFLSSCASIDKLVESGDYDGAVLLAIRKMQGKKNKKTKYVKGLEEAFAKINAYDLDQAKRLINQNQDSNWDQIHDIYTSIDDRQTAITPLLPLTSKDGYRASFTFVKVSSLINDAAKNAAAYQYNRGTDLLVRGKKGDKDASRQAYVHFQNTKNYFRDFKNSASLANEALYYGKTRVLVDVVNRAPVVIPRAFEREVLNIHVRDLNTRWTEYFVTNHNDHPIDVHAVLEIRDMDISPEREFVNYYTDHKKIKDGFIIVKDKSGKVKKDSLGKVIKKDRFRKIKAEITEIRRTKSAFVRGNVYYYDKATGEKFRTQPVEVEAVFEDMACQFRGDRRAIKDSRLKYLKSYPAPFPSDLDITMDAAVSLKEVLKDEIDRAVF